MKWVNEKCIQGQICSVGMKSLDAKTKCPSCKAIANDKVDGNLLISDTCGIIFTYWVSATITILTVKDSSSNGKADLALDVAIFNK